MSQDNLADKIAAMSISGPTTKPDIPAHNHMSADNQLLSLDDVKDRDRIVEDIHRDLPRAVEYWTQAKQLTSLFYHVSNVDCLYKIHGKEAPAWYVHKYGHLFGLSVHHTF